MHDIGGVAGWQYNFNMWRWICILRNVALNRLLNLTQYLDHQSLIIHKQPPAQSAVSGKDSSARDTESDQHAGEKQLQALLSGEPA